VNKYIKVLIFILLLSFNIPCLIARDIDLDAIYISKTSPSYKTLFQKKLNAYQYAGSRFISRNVAFAGWATYSEIVYIVERGKANIIMLYDKLKDRKYELLRIRGTINSVKMSPNGQHMYVKRMIFKGYDFPKGEIVIINIRKKTKKIIKSSHLFVDFSLSPAGHSLLYENLFGIIEHFPESDISRIVGWKWSYASIKRNSSPVIMFFSPDKRKKIIISGSGGSYKAKLFQKGSISFINGITSSEEIHWITNNRIVFRKGYTGNYWAYEYNVLTNTGRRISPYSMNTNIHYSYLSKYLTCLDEQLIQFYNIKDRKRFLTGLEGEDVCFAPTGNYFISLLYKRLFLTNILTLKRNSYKMHKNAKSIHSFYQSLLHKKAHHENNYSPRYISKKIESYANFLKSK